MAHYDFKLLDEAALLYRNTRDEASFRKIEKAIRGYCFKSIIKSNNFSEEHEDTYQRVLVELVRFLQSPSWNPERQPFHGMLVRIISNAIRRPYGRDYVRAKQFQESLVPISSLPFPEDIAEDRNALTSAQILSKVAVDNILQRAPPSVRPFLLEILKGNALRKISQRGRCPLSSGGISNRLHAFGKHLLAEEAGKKEYRILTRGLSCKPLPKKSSKSP